MASRDAEYRLAEQEKFYPQTHEIRDWPRQNTLRAMTKSLHFTLCSFLYENGGVLNREEGLISNFCLKRGA